jgi:hypothetical protein
MKYRVSLIPEIFPGFYNTHLDPGEIERYDENEELEEEFTDEQWIEKTTNLCEYFVELINELTPFTVESWELVSPYAYNYHNDVLWFVIDTTPEKILFETINHEASGDLLLEMIDWTAWEDESYHDALLEQLIAYPLFGYEETFVEKLY